MDHLRLESLARLVDELPTTEERAHLAICGECRQELEALLEQTGVLRGLPDQEFEAGEVGWGELEARLQREGLLRDSAGSPEIRRSSPAWMRLAAALLLFLAGGAAGWGARGSGEVEVPAPVAGDVNSEVWSSQVIAPEPSAPGVAVEAVPSDTDRFAAVGEDFAVQTAASHADAASPTSDPVPTSFDLFSLLVALPSEAATLEEAEVVVQVAEQFYGDALAAYRRFLETSGQLSSEDPVGRYMALGNLIAIAEEAVRTAPADPFLNSLLITSVVERDAVEQGMTRIAAEY